MKLSLQDIHPIEISKGFNPRFIHSGRMTLAYLHPGQVVAIPSNVPHSGHAVSRCRILDVFQPVREHYVSGSVLLDIFSSRRFPQMRAQIRCKKSAGKSAEICGKICGNLRENLRENLPKTLFDLKMSSSMEWEVASAKQ
jgi:hypothetical protein